MTIFQIIALVILASFYGCYFAKMLEQRKKGIQTDQMGKGKQGVAMLIERTMKATSFLAVIAETVSIALGTSRFPLWVRIAGIGFGVAGVAVFVVAVAAMRDNWRAGVSKTDKTELVTNGIFAYSRNPAFLGFDLVYVGILLTFFNWMLFLATALAILMFHLQIVNVEEPFLREAFAEEYQTYRNTVRRYFGRRQARV